MDKERVAQIIREQGYSPRFRDYVGRKGNGVSRTFVYAIAPGIGRALGNLSTIAQMSDDELRTHIKAKFAPPPITGTISGAQFIDILMGREG